MDTGFALAYTTEAVLWGGFIDQHFAELSPNGDKITVASLVSNNDFGVSYDLGFRAYLEQSANKDKIEYVSEKIEPTAPTVTDAMTTLAAENPRCSSRWCSPRTAPRRSPPPPRTASSRRRSTCSSVRCARARPT